jgi:hypothetical protein
MSHYLIVPRDPAGRPGRHAVERFGAPVL